MFAASSDAQGYDLMQKQDDDGRGAAHIPYVLKYVKLNMLNCYMKESKYDTKTANSDGKTDDEGLR